MEYLVNPDKPKIEQVLKAIKKEQPNCKCKYLVVGAMDHKVAEQFVLPKMKTIFVHDADSVKVTDETIEELKKKNISYLDGEHNLGQLAHSLSGRYKTMFPSEILASSVYNLEKSVQKCIEIAVNAVDKKEVPAGTTIISVAGEGDEPDTAIVMEPSYSTRIIDTKIIKIICHLFHKDW